MLELRRLVTEAVIEMNRQIPEREEVTTGLFHILMELATPGVGGIKNASETLRITKEQTETIVRAAAREFGIQALEEYVMHETFQLLLSRLRNEDSEQEELES